LRPELRSAGDSAARIDRPAAAIPPIGNGATQLLPDESDASDAHAGSDRASLQLRDGPRLDVLTAPPGAAGSYLVHLTGSADHNVQLRQRARLLGWSLSEHGLVPLADEDSAAEDSAALTFATEADLYAFLGLAEVPPELREARGEIEAAERGALPVLVRRADLRGDCHSHSDWSDGREPLEVMAESARRDGREYQVLSDHSHSLTIARGLSPARVEAQRRVIGELNERFARELAAGELPEGASTNGFQLLHGTELEITLDGRLDYDDELLARFDVVVASLHVGRRQPRAQLMARYELAMRSPHVDIISHPSGRKIGRRAELDLDWQAFYRLAAETGTLLEINGSEARLDLDEHHIRAAMDAGCRFTIDSDAHERAEWQGLSWGCAIARRGWLGPERVANTLPREAFLALMQEKPHQF
jgi:DNA polymerase (family 10)